VYFHPLRRVFFCLLSGHAGVLPRYCPPGVLPADQFRGTPMSARDALQARLEQGATTLGLRLTAPVIQQLLDYQALLARWNAAYNLTAVRDPAQMITRHLLDSLAILPYLRGDSLADLGTGPGLPGLVLAIAAPGREVLLVDSNGKKVRFLREAIRALKLGGVRAVQSRVEDVQGQFDCITARAFASFADMLGWGGHLLAPDGIWLAMKGRQSEDDLDGVPAAFAVRDTHVLTVPGLDAERRLVVLGHA
jgi:16S rRNA (guanine527-N7)-methyltransferase